MHPMRLVISYLCLSLLAVPFEMSAFAQAMPVLDLTKVPSAERKSLGVPGQQVGGTPEQKPAKSGIPIAIRIRSAGVDKTSLKVQIMVTNRGGSTYALPSCTDQRIAQLGGTKRRTFEFGFEFVQGAKRKSEVAEVTFASEQSKCSIPLSAGGSALVIMNVNIPPEFRSSVEPIQVQAVCKEWILDDRRFYITSVSDTVKSPPVEIRLR